MAAPEITWRNADKVKNSLGQTVPGGHMFELDEDGDIEFYEGGEYHSGPACSTCRNVWCQHCTPDIYMQKCPDLIDGSVGAAPEVTAVTGTERT